jgi:hypothetical protein
MTASARLASDRLTIALLNAAVRGERPHCSDVENTTTGPANTRPSAPSPPSPAAAAQWVVSAARRPRLTTNAGVFGMGWTAVSAPAASCSVTVRQHDQERKWGKAKMIMVFVIGFEV